MVSLNLKNDLQNNTKSQRWRGHSKSSTNGTIFLGRMKKSNLRWLNKNKTATSWVRIIDFDPKKDTEWAQVEVVKAVDKKEIQIRFNKKIRYDLKPYEIEGIQLSDRKFRGVTSERFLSILKMTFKITRNIASH